MRRPHVIDLANVKPIPRAVDLVAEAVPEGPADGCSGASWCDCVDHKRVPAGGFFAHEDDWEW